MEIKTPKDVGFVIRNQRCPCFCGGEGFLLFITCPVCDFITVVCDEVGGVFPDAHNLIKPPIGSWLSDYDVCPNCHKSKLSSFRYSTPKEIESIGFSQSDYEPLQL